MRNISEKTKRESRKQAGQDSYWVVVPLGSLWSPGSQCRSGLFTRSQEEKSSELPLGYFSAPWTFLNPTILLCLVPLGHIRFFLQGQIPEAHIRRNSTLHLRKARAGIALALTTRSSWKRTTMEPNNNLINTCFLGSRNTLKWTRLLQS